MKKDEGNIGDMLAVCICMLALTTLMLSYMGSAGLVFQKTTVGQLARKYILRMETVGGLTEEDKVTLLQELEQMGLAEIVVEGTEDAGYGEPVELLIRGKLEEKYEVEERRMSTAKN